MKRKLLFAIAALLCSVGTWAQTDVTSTYLTNADFSSASGWTVDKSSSFSEIGTGNIGWTVKNYASTTDANHLATEYCSGFEMRWGGYSTYKQETSTNLPVGYYELSYDVQNTNTATTSGAYESRFKVTVGETTYNDAQTEWMSGNSSWTTHTIAFSIEEEAKATITLGLGCGSTNIGDKNTPVLYVSHLKLTKYSDKDTYLRIKNGLTEATYANPIVTSFVVNGTFDNNANGWSRTGGFQNGGTATNQQGAFTVPFWENWNPSAKENKMYQVIENIPNGTYRLDIAAFVNTLADPNESQYVFANNDKTYLTTGSPTAYEVYTVVTNNQIEIGLEQTTATANWMGIDNVSLRYYGAGDVINDAKNAAHKQAWLEAKAAAETAISNSDYANVTGSEKSDLETEIAKAEPSTAQGYDDAAAALNTATAAFTAAKAAYDAYAEIRGVAVALSVAPGDAPTNADAAVTATHSLNVAVYTATTADNIFDVTDVYAPSWSSMGSSNGQHWSGDTSISYADEWRGDTNPTERTATVTLPAGSYILMCAGRGSANTVTTRSANGTTVTFASNGDMGIGINKDGAASFDADDAAGFANKSGAAENSGTGWEWRFIPVTLSAETDVTIIQKLTRLTGSAWGSFCDFRILKKGVVADADDYAALNTAIENAEANTLGFEDGQYAPYENVAALEALAAAKAFDQTANNEKETVEAVTASLTSATWTANEGDVDAIYNGMYATVAAGANYPDGWTRTNGWGQMQSGLSGNFATAYYNQPGSLQYGNQGVYTMPLAANTAYQLTFSYRSHENNSNGGVTVSVLNGEDGMPAATFTKNGSTSEWADATAYFTTGAAGNYILTLANSGNTWMTNVSLVKFEHAASIDLTEEDGLYREFDRTYAKTVTVARTVKEGFNTVCMPFDMTAEQVADVFGAQATVYEFSENSADANNVTINFSKKEANTIAANVPVLIGGATASTEVKTFSNVMFKSGEAKVAGTNFDFVGTYEGNTIIEENDYFVGNGAIYKSAGSTTINAFRAYLDNKVGATEARLFIDGVETTGINEVIGKMSEERDGSFYDLQGRKVANPSRGLYIINGKKVIVK